MHVTPFTCGLALIIWLTCSGALQAELSPEALSAISLRGSYQNSLHQFEGKKKGHVAFLGGSITENKTGHSTMVPQWLQERFPDTEFNFTNAGISSTCSTTGAFRLEENVLNQGPVDLLIVEFAVNDDQDAMHARREALRGMEGIVRHTLKHNPNADVLMVQYVNPPILEKLEAGETPISIDAHEAVAEHYQLTSVNVGAALAAGAMDWETYGGTHPKKPGYRLASDMIIHALEASWKGAGAKGIVAHQVPDALDANSYDDGFFLDPATAGWMGGWEAGPVTKELLPKGSIRSRYQEDWTITVASEAGAMLTLPFRGRAVGAFVLAGPDAGILEASIDDGPFKPVDLYHHFSENLNYPRTVMFYTDLEQEYHQLTLRVAPRETGEAGGTRAAILTFVVNE